MPSVHVGAPPGVEVGDPMLPPFIIEQIRKREQEERDRQAERQPRVEIPLEPSQRPGPSDNDGEGDRGVVIVELG
jgi:hypothetical protein